VPATDADQFSTDTITDTRLAWRSWTSCFACCASVARACRPKRAALSDTSQACKLIQDVPPDPYTCRGLSVRCLWLHKRLRLRSALTKSER